MSNRLTTPVPENYASVLAAVEDDVKSARTRAVLAANTELITLYFSIGRRLSEEASGWGERAVERLAEDLRGTFPDMKGFSRSNLFNMRRIWLAWRAAPDSVQQLVGRIPWGHHILLATRVPDPEARLFYARGIIEHGWSRWTTGFATRQMPPRSAFSCARERTE